MNSTDAYRLAQSALADLKTAVRAVVEQGGQEGLRNAEIGRTLGIYAGHQGHEGHISRTLLEMLANEGVIVQEAATKKWRLRMHAIAATQPEAEE